jgi:hypothetical protein
MHLRRWTVPFVFGLVALVGSCRDGTGPDGDPWDRPCPQTSEFGNFGCVRVVVMTSRDPAAWEGSLFSTADLLAELPHYGSAQGAAADSGEVTFRLQMTLWFAPEPAFGDSVPIRVYGRLLRSLIGAPPFVSSGPELARDSSEVFVRWAPVGGFPAIDTVRLVFDSP